MSYEPLTVVTIEGVSATVLVDGYQKGNGFGDGPWRKIRYKCRWEDSDAFMDALVGLPGVVYAGVLYPTPHRYPGNGNIYCLRASCTQYAGSPGPDRFATGVENDKLFAAEWALIEAEYGQTSFPITAGDDPAGASTFDGTPGIPFAKCKTRKAYRTYSVPASSLKVGAEGNYNTTTYSDAVGRITSHEFTIPQIEYLYTFEMWPAMPMTVMQGLNGSLNDDTFWGCERGTLLFMAGDCDPVKAPTGAWLANAEFSILWQPLDHNAAFDEVTGEPILVARKDGVFNHPYKDFGILLP